METRPSFTLIDGLGTRLAYYISACTSSQSQIFTCELHVHVGNGSKSNRNNAIGTSLAIGLLSAYIGLFRAAK